LLLRTEHLPEVVLADIVDAETPLEPLILDDVCMPPYAGPTDHDDLLPLLKIAKALQPRLVVELGTAHGNSVANICRQCPDARIITVNAPVEDQSGDTVTFELTRGEIGRVYRQHGFEERVTQLFENTLDLDLSGQLGVDQTDLAIVDACHDTEYVLNDFFKVMPFTRPGGLVLFHDTHPSARAMLTRDVDSSDSHLIGSFFACLKLRRRGFDVRHLKDTWWGVWRKPS